MYPSPFAEDAQLLLADSEAMSCDYRGARSFWAMEVGA